MQARRLLQRTALTGLLSVSAAIGVSTEASAAGFVHPKIDSSAQFALSSLASDGPDGAREAAMVLGAVEAGALGGVYLADQGVPAQRARQLGTNWWSIHPSGVDGVVLPAPASDPGGRPILVLRKSVATKPNARKQALREAFGTFAMMQAQAISPCGGGDTAVPTVAGPTHCVTSSVPVPFVRMPRAIELIVDRAHPWGTDYVGPKPVGKEPICARSFAKYSVCKTLIGSPKPPKGNEIFPLRPASSYESGGGTPAKLTKPLLFHIMSPTFNGTEEQQREKAQNLERALPQLRRTFDLFGLDTVRSQAHFLAHYGGELGGNPGNLGIVETFTSLSCPEPNKKKFLGRGPLQVTCKVAYVMALAYLELRHDQLVLEEVNAALVSSPTSVWRAFEDAVSNVGVKSLASAHRAIKADPNAAGRFSNGFVLSGAYWHASGCGKDMVELGKVADVKTGHFIGSQPGSKCISGGGQSHSGNDRAKYKACIYNVAMKSLKTGKAEQHACMANASSSASKPRPKTHRKVRPTTKRRQQRLRMPKRGG
ncbi:MAG: hypothetical protein ACE37F_29815 [Nannocystaceae bacterium]|nr:hypothetical protein [bacterium]